VTYRFLPHTADIRVAFQAADLAGLLQDAVEVSRKLFVGESTVENRQRRRIAIDVSDAEELLLAFLRELLFAYETAGFLPLALTVRSLSPSRLRGELGGERLEPARHDAEPEVKAVTRHGFFVRETERGWEAEVLFDV